MEIILSECCYEYDEERSYYNHNYYKLKDYGDWLVAYVNNLYVYEVCHEDENCYTATLGYFTDYGNFVPIFSCTNGKSVFED